MFPQDW